MSSKHQCRHIVISLSDVEEKKNPRLIREGKANCGAATQIYYSYPFYQYRTLPQHGDMCSIQVH